MAKQFVSKAKIRTLVSDEQMKQLIEDLRNSIKVEPFPGMPKSKIAYVRRKLVKLDMIR